MSSLKILGIIISIPFGLGAGYCILQSWMSLVNAIINLIGFLRGKRERSYTALAFVIALIQVLVFSGLLFLIDYVLRHTRLSYTYSQVGQILFFVFMIIQMLFMLIQVPAKIRKLWLNANYDKSKLLEMEIKNSEKIIIS